MVLLGLDLFLLLAGSSTFHIISMNRRTFLKKGAVLGATAALIPTRPVLADHIVEPQSPITEYTMEVYVYPNFSTRLVKGDGTERLFDINGNPAVDARFETFVEHRDRSLGVPSEHYDETLTLFIVENFGTRREVERYEWRVSWKHSNIEAHRLGGVGGNGPESSQNSQNLRAYAPGTILRFHGDLTTLESGQQLSVQKTFRVG